VLTTNSDVHLGCLLLSLCAGSAIGATINVPSDYSTLQAAIDAAQTGDEIVVGPGQHQAGIMINKAITIRSESGAESTTLVGSGNGPVVILEESDGNGGGTLTGFTISNGTGVNGGGLFLSGDVAVVDCTVTNNRAINGGGAFIVGNPVLSEVRFFRNDAEFGGGVFYAPDAGAILDFCDFFGNSAGLGGGIYISPRGNLTTYATIGAATFENNEADDGGAIYTFMGGFDLVDATFARNYAAGRGGSIYSSDGEFSSVSSASIRDGDAEEGGAVYLDGAGEFRLQECEINGNSASDWSAAVTIDDSHELDVRQTTVWENSPQAFSGDWNDLGSNSFEVAPLCEIDYASPTGTIDMQDLMAFVQMFTSRDARADIAPPKACTISTTLWHSSTSTSPVASEPGRSAAGPD
jgi:predicted outer membrane repeat protein